MSAPEFKAGDRVRRGAGIEGVIVGPDQRPTHSDRWIVWTPKDDESTSPFGEWTSWGPDQMTLVPDTATVTVEVPRDEAEAVVRFVTNEPWATNPEAGISAPDDSVVALDTRACRRLRAALLKALS